MITVNYQKRKNIELFKAFEDPELLYLSTPQNYVPLYTKFFNLNETNYNNINLNNKWFISNVEKNEEVDNENIFSCKLKNIDNNKIKRKDVFFKIAPLLEPYKYLIGKYDINDSKLFNLPKIDSTLDNCNSKMLDLNNSAYVDSLFLFLSSELRSQHNFNHGIEFYGSYLGIKNNFKINVFDDLDYLNNSDFFNKNKNILFKIDDYAHLFQKENDKLKPIKIGNNVSLKSLQSVDNDIFENIFDDTNTLDLNDLKDMSIDLIDLTYTPIISEKKLTLKSNSTCSSRSSHTNEDNTSEYNTNEDTIEENCENCSNSYSESDIKKNDETSNYEFDNEVEDDVEDDVEDEDEEEERIDVTIPKFPVQIISMENCENTFDDLILNNDLSNEEWFSAFMQIIMILITYQKAFNFTHNDLHTNNIMYNYTDKKFIYYCYKKTYYKVPTFGRLFKIIDFGRSIFKFDGKLFCSDSFKNGGDAATQYNTEPYFDDKKPRLEPNPSFDLCRLACSIFDYVIYDLDEIKDLSKIKDPVKQLIYEWCLDDKGTNMLYKNNGLERYPEFKLYKMIARCVHYHTPQAQLERPEFNSFSKNFNDINKEIKNIEDIIDIDKIPSYI
jgi:hypothetical protein